LEKRGLGVDSKATLATTPRAYPWREDAISIYKVIHNYVDQFLKVFYENPNTILADAELQEWYQGESSFRSSGGH
jgi:hypothetical protein